MKNKQIIPGYSLYLKETQNLKEYDSESSPSDSYGGGNSEDDRSWGDGPYEPTEKQMASSIAGYNARIKKILMTAASENGWSFEVIGKSDIGPIMLINKIYKVVPAQMTGRVLKLINLKEKRTTKFDFSNMGAKSLVKYLQKRI